MNTRTLRGLAALAVVACALGLTVDTAHAADAHPMAAVDLTKPIHGTPLTLSDMRGKVVFLEYWGIDCGPCLASFPHLIEKHEKYARSGRLVIVASHVQADVQRATKFVQDKQTPFSVFHQVRVPAAPCGRGIPHAAIIDHTGKVVAEGHPMQLLPQLDAYIAQAPGGFSPIVGDMLPEHHTALAKKLEPGSSIASTYRLLQRESERGDDAEKAEAQALVEQIDKWIDGELDQASSLASTKPSAALAMLTELNKTIGGMDQQQALLEQLRPLSQDRNVRALMAVRDQLDRLAKLRSSSRTPAATAERLADQLTKRCDAILADADISAGVRAEAEGLKQEIADAGATVSVE